MRQPSHTDALAQAQGDSEYFVSASFFSALLLRMAVIDGAYFGTTFPHLLMMTHPDLFERRPFRALSRAVSCRPLWPNVGAWDTAVSVAWRGQSTFGFVD